MRWSWKFGKLAGIEIYVHFTMLALLAWIVLQHWLAGHNAATMLAGIAFVAAIFVSILLHEYGHALMARRYGIGTRDITLLPIGGLARLERIPEVPRQELAVALAGPAVNVVIAVLLYSFLSIQGVLRPVAELGITAGPFLERLMIANLFLAAFNMIPALPMDGGRVLRALLASRMNRARATRIAGTIAQGVALVFAVVGVFTNPMLMLIALFVWMGAAQESADAQVRSVLTGVPVEHAMVTEFRSLNVLDTPQRAVEAVISTSQRDFPVLHGNRFIGMLLQHELLSALSADTVPYHLGQIVRRECVSFAPGEALSDVFAKIATSDQGCFPVLQDGRVVGLLTIENILEFVAFRRVVNEQEPLAA